LSPREKVIDAEDPELQKALRGRLTEHHRFMLTQAMAQLDHLERQIAAFDARIRELTRPFQEAIRRLMTIPGIGQRVAEIILAEIGADMSRFPSAAHLASWAGMCPGNGESAGKRHSGRTRPGDAWLEAALNQAAWAASRSRKTYLSSQYRRLASRRGKKRAIVAVGHTMLVMIYHILRDEIDYHELGPDYFDRLRTPHLTRYHVKRLQSLGFDVTLAPLQEAA